MNKSLLIFLLASVTALSALVPAGRVLPPIQSSTRPLDDNVDQWNRRQQFHHHKSDRVRVYNQYFYPYSPYYSGTYYSGGYYGYPPPYISRDPFPDDTEADYLFDQLSR